MYKIFIVEDDTVIANSIKNNIESWGFPCRACDDLRNVLKEFIDFKPHLVILDIMLPFFDGYYWCKEIRKLSDVPIIFLSSASDNMNIIMAMNMGGDDFVIKPFDINVLTAKIQALLRRSYNYASQKNLIEHEGLILDTSNTTLSYNDKKIDLTKNEYRILLTLLENKGKIISRDTLMQKLWETDSFVDENTLTVNVTRLRKKLCEYGIDNFIRTKKGLGYIIE
ncbi:MAG: response regulator transcription factor [Clostridiales bacterium]|nr:response regulator transcription factor [Clostridiales bacterium]